uniref:Uncharacterized protein n=1 Tax=viral metagenome TaxID=1070528 RepID=A0A6C0EL47_9ZZZZ
MSTSTVCIFEPEKKVIPWSLPKTLVGTRKQTKSTLVTSIIRMHFPPTPPEAFQG